MYTKVVIPLDGSELAEGVLPHVAEVIRGRNSTVYLLTVVPVARVTPSVLADFLSSSDGTRERQTAKSQLTAYLQALAHELAPIAQTQTRVCFGHPADEILSFANDVEADLITVSTHGRSGISRWVLGSVTDRILHATQCPMLLIRAKPQSASQNIQHPPARYQRILIPLDGSDLAEQALPYVTALIRPNYTRIFLVSVLSNGLSDRTLTLLTSSPPGLHLSTTALSKAKVQLTSYMRSVAAALRERGANVHTAVRQGAPAEEILAHAAQVKADVISMTAHGLSGISRWVYGNVAGKILQGAPCPILLVHPSADKTSARSS
jgi:nucleotide-binding universal stress UspA family protein